MIVGWGTSPHTQFFFYKRQRGRAENFFYYKKRRVPEPCCLLFDPIQSFLLHSISYVHFVQFVVHFVQQVGFFVQLLYYTLYYILF
jgi:hypothetical protein